MKREPERKEFFSGFFILKKYPESTIFGKKAMGYSSQFYEEMTSVLGGEEVIGAEVHNEFELHELVQKGISIHAIKGIARFFDLDESATSELLEIPLRTGFLPASSSKISPTLSRKVTEHLLKLAELITRGKEVFGDEANFKRWLNNRIGAFWGKKPIEYINSVTGIDFILDELGRIEHGVHS